MNIICCLILTAVIKGLCVIITELAQLMEAARSLRDEADSDLNLFFLRALFRFLFHGGGSVPPSVFTYSFCLVLTVLPSGIT